MGENSQYAKIVEVSKITGYGEMYCLRALKETNWDVEKAVKYLKEHPPVYLT
ncbi:MULTISPECIES: translation elongation factor Ts [unclassified Clostridium]|uniref:translation elongation factor Ts n=1 Tax=unclassified Clostridium TaxID=2614128 RepID=UPI0002981E93|nr:MULTISPECIES: translation elongation factor Ts [unclassified Clostridium]EKQ51441.1 MAG: translation elongation factor Ts [Clostridium sp. Maddingley MBC34-26]